jgi:thiaminase/transcriptional activator TenA
VTGSGPLTAELWSSIDATYGAILEHPFIAGLTDGSLDQAAFRVYVIQDAHYLREFARALSVAAARAPEERDIAMFNEHAAGAIAVERQLHESFFSDFGVSEADVAATPMAPTNLAYTSYLLAVASPTPSGLLHQASRSSQALRPDHDDEHGCSRRPRAATHAVR